MNAHAILRPEDLVTDRALRAHDPDRFDHEAIAGQVALLIQQVHMPSNIALFGPWGSGKSSFFELLRRHLADDASTKLVYYDAWKFGGQSLLRNLISHTATELGLEAKDHARFHRGLYESRRSVDFDFSKIRDVRRLLVSLLALVLSLAASALIVGVVAWVVSLGSEGIAFVDVLHEQMVSLSPRLAIPVAAAVLAILAVDLLKVESEKSAPTEAEEFNRTFAALVQTALDTHRAARLVVFIDELDRCSSRDVSATLAHLKTFLGNDRCVFVVAADRSVVEEGLDGGQLSRSVTEQEPYYSSASGYLDKIFQHQFALPPLRGTKLNTFAYELAEDRTGLWAELRSESQGLFDDVMYTLIPTHVRSPRRVKVLLNNFATTARVAQARNIDWLRRATEIAKLTVFQTEYPTLGRDLHLENRLPTWLLDPPSDPSELQRDLLAKHALDVDDTGVEVTGDGNGPTQPVPPDRLLGPASQDSAVLKRQRDELRRYLHRTAGTPDPGRDLLFLDALGASAGLDDSELSRILEELAPETPDVAVEALASRPHQTQLVGLRVLAESSERERGRDRANLIHVIAAGAEPFSVDELKEIASPILAAIRSFMQRAELSDSDLPGVLRIAVAAGSSGSAIAQRLISDERLQSTELVTRVVDLVDHLDEKGAAAIVDAVGRCWTAGDYEPMLRGIGVLGHSARTLLHRLRPVLASSLRAQTLEAQRVSATQLIQALLTRQDAELVTEATTFLLELQEEGTYDAVDEHAAALLAELPPAQQNMVGLTALLRGPASHWVGWSENLKAGRGEATGLVAAVIHDLLTRAIEAPENRRSGLAEIVSRVLTVGKPEEDPSFWNGVQAASSATLGATDWWTTDEMRSQQEHIYAALLRLRSALPTGSNVIDDVLVEDLSRPLIGLSDATSAHLTQLRTLAKQIPSPVAQDLEAKLPDLTTPAARAEVTATKVLLRSLSGAEQAQKALTSSEIINATAQLRGERGKILSNWLASEPNVPAVADVARKTFRLSTQTSHALSKWATGLSESQRTQFIKELMGARSDPAWLSRVAESGVREATVARHARELLSQETRWQNRERVARRLGAIEWQSRGAGRELANAAIELLATKKNVDIGIAAELVPYLCDGYGRKKALSEAFQNADLTALTRAQQRTLENAGLVSKKRLRRVLEGLTSRGKMKA